MSSLRERVEGLVAKWREPTFALDKGLEKELFYNSERLTCATEQLRKRKEFSQRAEASTRGRASSSARWAIERRWHGRGFLHERMPLRLFTGPRLASGQGRAGGEMSCNGGDAGIWTVLGMVIGFLLCRLGEWRAGRAEPPEEK